MRLDLMSNILTFQALTKREINVFGGKQIRPFIHIEDMVDMYLFFLKKNIKPGAYNASFGNLSALNTAEEIIKFMPNCKINIKKSNDPRSYRLSNQKILNAGFKFKVDIERGIKDFIKKYQEGKIKSNENAYSINFINKIKKK